MRSVVVVLALALALSVAPAALAAPNTQLHGGPYGSTSARSATFHGYAPGAARIQCKLDRGAWFTCVRSGSGYIRLRNLRRGSHTLLARAVGRNGSVDRTPAKRTWRVR